MQARLLVHFAERPSRSFPLAVDHPQVIGRDPSCAVVIDDDRISRRHARLTATDGRWRLEDLGSKNGTSLEGRPLTESENGLEIPDGAWISLGGLLVQLESLSSEKLASEARRDAERWRTSLGLQARFDPSAGLESLLQQVLRSILEVGGCERGFVLLSRPDGGLELMAIVGVEVEDLHTAEFSGSVGAVSRALSSGRPVALADVSADTVLGARPSIIANRVATLICLPLVVMGRTIGAIYADSHQVGGGLSDLDVEILTALASHAGLAIGVAQLHREVVGLGEEMPQALDRSLPAYRPTGDWRHGLTVKVGPEAGA